MPHGNDPQTRNQARQTVGPLSLLIRSPKTLIKTLPQASAADRALTVRLLATPTAAAKDFNRPGHLFPLVARPGGVLERGGHTEASVDLCLVSVPAQWWVWPVFGRCLFGVSAGEGAGLYMVWACADTCQTAAGTWHAHARLFMRHCVACLCCCWGGVGLAACRLPPNCADLRADAPRWHHDAAPSMPCHCTKTWASHHHNSPTGGLPAYRTAVRRAARCHSITNRCCGICPGGG